MQGGSAAIQDQPHLWPCTVHGSHSLMHKCLSMLSRDWAIEKSPTAAMHPYHGAARQAAS